MRLVFATGNKGKLKEAREILGPSFEIVSPAEVGVFDEVEETGSTLAENSLLKAKHLYEKTGLCCFADDTGLEVEALGGEPGVYSARYAGPDADFDANIAKLLGKLDGVENRRAAFRCVVTLIYNGEVVTFDGFCPGTIALEKSGNRGFGYDPVFIADEIPGHTWADVPEAEKDAISHRGRSLRAMAEWLEKR